MGGLEITATPTPQRVPMSFGTPTKLTARPTRPPSNPSSATLTPMSMTSRPSTKRLPTAFGRTS
eukprot:3376422-Lingulodinium_polyedra.AAC.1